MIDYSSVMPQPLVQRHAKPDEAEYDPEERPLSVGQHEPDHSANKETGGRQQAEGRTSHVKSLAASQASG